MYYIWVKKKTGTVRENNVSNKREETKGQESLGVMLNFYYIVYEMSLHSVMYDQYLPGNWKYF